MFRIYLYWLLLKIWISVYLSYVLKTTYLMGLIVEPDFDRCAPRLEEKLKQYRSILQGIILSRAFGMG